MSITLSIRRLFLILSCILLTSPQALATPVFISNKIFIELMDRLGAEFENQAGIPMEQLIKEYKEGKIQTIKAFHLEGRELLPNDSHEPLLLSPEMNQWIKEIQESIQGKFTRQRDSDEKKFPDANRLLVLSRKDSQAAVSFVRSLTQFEAKVLVCYYFDDLNPQILRSMMAAASGATLLLVPLLIHAIQNQSFGWAMISLIAPAMAGRVAWIFLENPRASLIQVQLRRAKRETWQLCRTLLNGFEE